jgi:hypothetical protein
MTTAPGPAPRGVRARDADRQQVIDALSEAHANGQLAFDEFEERSRAASAALTLDQLSGLTSDLQNAPAIGSPAHSRGVDGLDDIVISTLAMTKRPPVSAKRRLVMGLVGLGILTSIVVGVMLAVASTVGDGSVLGGDEAALHTASGFDEFVADAREEFGTTRVASVVVYPTYAVVSVPVADEPRHLESVYYDGSFDEPSAGGTRQADDALVDLADIDGNVVAQLVDQAPVALGVPDPTTVYAIVETWGDPAQPALSVYASDSYDNGYLVAAADGHLLDAYPAAD